MRVTALLVLLTLVLPFQVEANGSISKAPAVTILNAIDLHGDRLGHHNGGLLDHLHGHCHQAVWPEQKTMVAPRVVSAGNYLPRADRQPGSGPAAPPFEPPRTWQSVHRL